MSSNLSQKTADLGYALEKLGLPSDPRRIIGRTIILNITYEPSEPRGPYRRLDLTIYCIVAGVERCEPAGVVTLHINAVDTSLGRFRNFDVLTAGEALVHSEERGKSSVLLKEDFPVDGYKAAFVLL